MFTFNNMSIMPDTTWDSADARQIRGTDGQLFPPMLEEGRDLEIFAGPMCRYASRPNVAQGCLLVYFLFEVYPYGVPGKVRIRRYCCLPVRISF